MATESPEILYCKISLSWAYFSIIFHCSSNQTKIEFRSTQILLDLDRRDIQNYSNGPTNYNEHLEGLELASEFRMAKKASPLSTVLLGFPTLARSEVFTASFEISEGAAAEEDPPRNETFCCKRDFFCTLLYGMHSATCAPSLPKKIPQSCILCPSAKAGMKSCTFPYISSLQCPSTACSGRSILYSRMLLPLLPVRKLVWKHHTESC